MWGGCRGEEKGPDRAQGSAMSGGNNLLLSNAKTDLKHMD